MIHHPSEEKWPDSVGRYQLLTEENTEGRYFFFSEIFLALPVPFLQKMIHYNHV
jgi:hypothetical protein